jgi:hypothetical protein
MSDEALFALTCAINTVILLVVALSNGMPLDGGGIAGAIGLSLFLSFFCAPIIGAEAGLIDEIISCFRKRRQNAKANETLAQ